MTPEKLTAAAAVWGLLLTLAGGIVSYIFHQRDEFQKTEMTRLDKNLAAAFVQIDKLKEDRFKFFTVADYDKWRSEIKSDIQAMEGRIVNEIEKVNARLSSELSHLRGKE